MLIAHEKPQCLQMILKYVALGKETIQIETIISMFTAYRRGLVAEVRLLLAGFQVATEVRKADRIFQLSVGIHSTTSWRFT